MSANRVRVGIRIIVVPLRATRDSHTQLGRRFAILRIHGGFSPAAFVAPA
ncbi:MAG TPA: hypothetical protein VF980_20830 [Thermoanaerobaculia bacterium]